MIVIILPTFTLFHLMIILVSIQSQCHIFDYHSLPLQANVSNFNRNHHIESTTSKIEGEAEISNIFQFKVGRAGVALNRNDNKIGTELDQINRNTTNTSLIGK